MAFLRGGVATPLRCSAGARKARTCTVTTMSAAENGGPRPAFARRDILQRAMLGGGHAPAAAADQQQSVFERAKARSKLIKLDSGVEYVDLKSGKGSYPQPGDLVIVNYVGYLSNGMVFDNSESPGRKPLAFRYGQSQVIKGWEEALSTMRPGGERVVRIPPELAYGSRGVCLENQGCLVQPNEPLQFELKLMRVAVSPI